MPYFVRTAAAKLLMAQFYYAYILTIPYTCADPEIFSEVQGLFSAILLYVYIRNLKNPHPTLDLRMLIWMEINAIPAWIGEMLKDNNGQNPLLPPHLSLSLLDLFLFMFIQKLNIYIYVISACHMLEENYIKIIISELLFNILRQHSGEQCIKIITSSHRRAFYVEFYYHLLHCFNIKCSFLFLFLSHIFVSLNFVK